MRSTHDYSKIHTYLVIPTTHTLHFCSRDALITCYNRPWMPCSRDKYDYHGNTHILGYFDYTHTLHFCSKNALVICNNGPWMPCSWDIHNYHENIHFSMNNMVISRGYEYISMKWSLSIPIVLVAFQLVLQPLNIHNVVNVDSCQVIDLVSNRLGSPIKQSILHARVNSAQHFYHFRAWFKISIISKYG